MLVNILCLCNLLFNNFYIHIALKLLNTRSNLKQKAGLFDRFGTKYRGFSLRHLKLVPFRWNVQLLQVFTSLKDT